jgi:hypothetical protein
MSDNMNKGCDQAVAFQKLRDLFHFYRPMSSVANERFYPLVAFMFSGRYK